MEMPVFSKRRKSGTTGPRKIADVQTVRHSSLPAVVVACGWRLPSLFAVWHAVYLPANLPPEVAAVGVEETRLPANWY